MNQQTIDMLTAMKMTSMAAEFANQLQDSSFRELGFEERLAMLVTAEWNRRQTNKVNRLIKSAHFSVPSAAIESIEYHEDRKLDKAQILQLSTCQYIDEGHHVILKGASGNGKTYIACALRNAACRRLKKVSYIRMPELLDELSIAPNPESDSPVSEAIMDRIIHNSYEIMVEGRISMRERKGLKAASSEEGSSNG